MTQPEPRHPKPNILLIDIPEVSAAILKSSGYTVEEGSFGRVIRSSTTRSFASVLVDTIKLPMLIDEQDIVFVNAASVQPEEISATDALRQSSLNKANRPSVTCVNSVMNVRPYAMRALSSHFERIVNHGGILIMFVHDYQSYRYKEGLGKPEFEASNWHILPSLSNVFCGERVTRETKYPPIAPPESELQSILRQWDGAIDFGCHLNVSSGAARATVIAKNRYDEVVSATLRDPRYGKGHVVFLPRSAMCIPEVLLEIVEKYCTAAAPHLFPTKESQPWWNEPEYELPHVARLYRQISDIESRAAAEIVQIQEQVAATKIELSYRQSLLTDTGAPLALAVIKSLVQDFGFRKVIDVDKDTDNGDKREDIRIEDRSPTLVVDVKGLSKRPTDDDCLQADKHANILRCELDVNYSKVKAVAIINHQRGLAPRERDKEVFRPEIVTVAKRGLCLLTTWDIYRLIHTAEELGWSKADLQSVLYRSGSPGLHPDSYVLLGTVMKRFDKHRSFAVDTEHPVAVGDVLAVEVDAEPTILFMESKVTSLRCADDDVQALPTGAPAGIVLETGFDMIRKNCRVFVVRRGPSS